MSNFDDSFKKAMVAAGGGRTSNTMTAATEARKASLLSKEVNFRGAIMTKKRMIETMLAEGGVLRIDHFPKHVFNRTKFNRMDYEEQKEYEKLLQEKMPYAIELLDGSFFPLTKTEADFFLSLNGKTA